MGAEQADAYGRRNAAPGELLVRVSLTKVIARKGVADWQGERVIQGATEGV